MEDKNEEEKFIKLDKKDIGLLKNINKDNRYKDLKPVKDINDIIKDLKIYEDKIGEKCSKFINKIAEEGEFKKSKLIDNCKEIKDAIKKKDKEEKKKKGKKPRKGKGTKDKAIKPLPEEKKKDDDLNKNLKKLLTDLTKSKSINDVDKALGNYASVICEYGVLDLFANNKLAPVLRDLFTTIKDNVNNFVFEGKIGFDNSGWNSSKEFYDILKTAFFCMFKFKEIRDYVKSFFTDSFRVVRDSFRRGSPPSSNTGRGDGDDDDDDDDDDDRPRRPKQIKGNNLLQIKDSSSIPNNSQIVAQNTNEGGTSVSTGMDAYRQMLINAKRKSSNTLRDATNTQTDNLVNEYYKNLAKQNKESEKPKTDQPPKTEPPKTDEPPKEETSYFRTGVGLATVASTALYALYDIYYGQQAPVNTDGENINMGGIRQEEGDIPPPRDEGLGRIDEDLEDAMSKEREEIEEAEQIEKEDRKKTAEEVDKEEQIKKVEDFMNNMGVSRNAFASVINPKLAGLSTFQLQNPILIGSAVSTGLDMLFGLPPQSQPQRSLTASLQERQDISELEKAEEDRMKMLTGSEETTEQRIQRESNERKEFDRQQEKTKQDQMKTQKELLEQKALEYTRQQEEERKKEKEMKELLERERLRNLQQSTTNILESREELDASLAGRSLLGLVGRPTNEFTLFHYTPIGQSPPSAMSGGTLRNIHNRTINRLQQDGIITQDIKRILNIEIRDFINDKNNYNDNGLLTAKARKDYMEIIKKYGLFKPKERKKK